MSNSEPTAGQIGTRHEDGPTPAASIYGTQKPPYRAGECGVCYGGGTCVPGAFWCRGEADAVPTRAELDEAVAELTQVAAAALRALAYFIRLRAAGAPERF